MSTNTHRFHKVGVRNKDDTSYYVDIEAVSAGGTSQSANKVLSLDLAETNSTLKLHGNLGVSSSGQTGSAQNDLDFTLTADSYVTVPTGNVTMADTASSQTFTNKTLTTPVISSISNTGTITLPTSTDTLVGRATTDTLTNKTLTSAVLNSSISGTSIKDEDDMASDSASHLATQQSIKAYVDGSTATMTNKTLTSAVLNSSISGTSIKDEDDMSSNSASHLATQQSIKAYVDSGTSTMTNKSMSGANNTFTALPLTALDIDGGTDIGAGLADADLLIVDDGAGGTNRKVAMSRVLTYIQNEVTNIVQATHFSSHVAISGNLNVAGTTTTFHSDQLVVDDPVITLAGNISGSDSLVYDTGILFNRGKSGADHSDAGNALGNAAMIWNELSSDEFQFVYTGVGTAAGTGNVFGINHGNLLATYFAPVRMGKLEVSSGSCTVSGADITGAFNVTGSATISGAAHTISSATTIITGSTDLTLGGADIDIDGTTVDIDGSTSIGLNSATTIITGTTDLTLGGADIDIDGTTVDINGSSTVTISATHTYVNSGSSGSAFQVTSSNSGADCQMINIRSGSDRTYLTLGKNSGANHAGYLQYIASSNTLNFGQKGIHDSIYFNVSSKKLGVGLAPTAHLHVSGSTILTGGACAITTDDGNFSITAGSGTVTLDCATTIITGSTDLTLGGADIDIDGTTVNIDGSTAITLNTATMALTSSGALNLESTGGTLTLDGTTKAVLTSATAIDINSATTIITGTTDLTLGGADIDVDGTTVNIDGSTSIGLSTATLAITAATTHDGNVSISDTLEVGDELLKAIPTGNTVIVSGGLKLGRNAPSTTTEKLYNNEGSLFWDGAAISTSSDGISTATNGVNNRISTFSAANALNGEANLTFDGSTFTVTGATVLTAGSLLVTTNDSAFTVTAGSGSVTLSGTNNSITAATKLTLGSAALAMYATSAFDITGGAASSIKTNNQNITVNAGTGDIIISASDVPITGSSTVKISTATMTITGDLVTAGNVSIANGDDGQSCLQLDQNDADTAVIDIFTQSAGALSASSTLVTPASAGADFISECTEYLKIKLNNVVRYLPLYTLT